MPYVRIAELQLIFLRICGNSMAFSTIGLVNMRVIFVFRHGKRLMY